MSREWQHTPGPWRYNIATDGKIVSPQERGPDVVVVEADAARPDDSWLIAAAPDLLEALESASDVLATLIGDDESMRLSASPTLSAVSAAIAKAKGEQS